MMRTAPNFVEGQTLCISGARSRAQYMMNCNLALLGVRFNEGGILGKEKSGSCLQMIEDRRF